MIALAQSSPFNTTFVFLAILAITVAFLLLRVQRYYGSQSSRPRPLAGPPLRPSEHGHDPDAPREFANWEVRMHDTARQLSAQLDSKLGLLEQLVREADRAASRLETALAAAQSGSPALRPVPPRPALRRPHRSRSLAPPARPKRFRLRPPAARRRFPPRLLIAPPSGGRPRGLTRRSTPWPITASPQRKLPNAPACPSARSS